MLPPLFQLEVNEFPHHPSLRQADCRQTSHPYGKHVEVAICQRKALVVRAWQPKAERQNRQREGEEAGDDKKQSPKSKTFLLVLVAEVKEA